MIVLHNPYSLLPNYYTFPYFLTINHIINPIFLLLYDLLLYFYCKHTNRTPVPSHFLYPPLPLTSSLLSLVPFSPLLSLSLLLFYPLFLPLLSSHFFSPVPCSSLSSPLTSSLLSSPPPLPCSLESSMNLYPSFFHLFLLHPLLFSLTSTSLSNLSPSLSFFKANYYR